MIICPRLWTPPLVPILNTVNYASPDIPQTPHCPLLILFIWGYVQILSLIPQWSCLVHLPSRPPRSRERNPAQGHLPPHRGLTARFPKIGKTRKKGGAERREQREPVRGGRLGGPGRGEAEEHVRESRLWPEALREGDGRGDLRTQGVSLRATRGDRLRKLLPGPTGDTRPDQWWELTWPLCRESQQRLPKRTKAAYCLWANTLVCVNIAYTVHITQTYV